MEEGPARVRRGAAVVLVLLVLAATAIAGCGGSGGTTTTTESTGAETTTSGTKPSTNASAGETGGETAMEVFQQQCSSCHILAAAKATFGTYGPNLDELKPSEAAVKSQVTNGGGIMPAFGKDGILTAVEIETVATYVAAEAGK
jgi:mono/diheme cytochrome c family protein